MIARLLIFLLVASSASQRNGDLSKLLEDEEWREKIDPSTTPSPTGESRQPSGQSSIVDKLQTMRQISNEVIACIGVFSAISAFIFGSIIRCIYLYFRVVNDPQLAFGDIWLNLVLAFCLTFGAHPQGHFGQPAVPAVVQV